MDRRGIRSVRSGRSDRFVTNSADETHEVGIQLGRLLRPPIVVLLRGTLGAGKTTLARGIAEGLGMRDVSRVSSPSFALVNIYQGRCTIYHVDLYRLEGSRDLYSTGIDEFLGQDGVTLVEWSERLTFPIESAVLVDIEDAGGDSRVIRVSRPPSARAEMSQTARQDRSSGNGIRSRRRRKQR